VAKNCKIPWLCFSQGKDKFLLIASYLLLLKKNLLCHNVQKACINDAESILACSYKCTMNSGVIILLFINDIYVLVHHP